MESASAKTPQRRMVTSDGLPEAEVFVDLDNPVALIRTHAGDRVVSWETAALPPTSASASVISSPNRVWVLYRGHGVADLREHEDHVTAVAIGPDGSWTDFDLGRVSVYGADEVGIWVERMPDVPELKQNPWNLPDFEDLPLLTHDEAFPARKAEQSVEALAQVTTGESWIGFVGSNGVPIRPTFDPPPGAPYDRPSSPTDLLRIRLDGDQDVLSVDRSVWSIDQAEGALAITYLAGDPTPPSGYGMMNYWTSQLRVRPIDPIADSIRVADHTSSAPRRHDLMGMWAAQVEETEPYVDVDLPMVDWSLRDPGPETIERVTEWTTNDLRSLGAPRGTYTVAAGTWARVQSSYDQVAVRVEGSWPLTQVIAEFTYRDWPGENIRIRRQVFDSAGAPAVPQYLSVYLDEDLATTKPEMYSRSPDGYIELPSNSN